MHFIKVVNSFRIQTGPVLVQAALISLFGIHTYAWGVSVNSTAEKRQGRFFLTPPATIPSPSPEETTSNNSPEINGYDLIFEIIEDYKNLSASSSAGALETEPQSLPPPGDVDPEKLSLLRMYQLNEILTSEEVFAEDLHLFLDAKVKTQGFRSNPALKTLFEELVDTRLIKKSERNFINSAIVSISEILAASRNRITVMKADFSMRSDQESLLKMERSVLTNLDPQEIRKFNHDYFLLYHDLFKILQRIEHSSEGEKVVHRRIKILKEKIKKHLLKGDRGRALTPTALAITPIQRFLKYPLLLKAIVDQPSKRLKFEYFSELSNLYQRFRHAATKINDLHGIMDTPRR